MSVLLVNPLVDKTKIYGRYHSLGGVLPPLGLAYIAAVLQRAGHGVRILDANVLGLADGQVLSEAAAYGPEVIGITATTLSHHRAVELARALKAGGVDCPVVLGGPHVLGMEEQTLADTCFDYAVSGEGEYAMLDLVEALRGNAPVDAIKGIVRRDGGEAVYNGDRPLLEDLDSLPFPARELLPDLHLYRPKAISYKRLPSTHLFTSRGCPYQCIFCRTAFGHKVRFHSYQRTIEEIEHLISRFGIREVIINDDTFILDRERVMSICESIRRKGIDITWSCNVRANLVDKELLASMKSAGCWEVAIGLESGSQEILGNLKKGITLEQGERACRIAYELGLYVRPSFILGSPGETEETIEQTIAYARSLPVHYPSFSLMTPFPGTELWNRADEWGTFDRSDLTRLSLSSTASFLPHGLTAEYLERAVKRAYKRTYLTPSMALRHLGKIRSLSDVKKIIRALKVLLG